MERQFTISLILKREFFLFTMREQDNNFYLLRQGGSFATRPSVVFTGKATRDWIKGLTNEERTKYRVTREQMFRLLDVNSYGEITNPSVDQTRRKEVYERGYRLLGSMYGIEGTQREIESKINSYADVADSVIEHIRLRVLTDSSPKLEMINEIQATNNPIDLLFIVFNERYHQKARFEAKRKLILMGLAGSIDQRERETDVENGFAQFVGFLNQHVWSKNTQIGEAETVYLKSEHDPVTFETHSIKVLDEKTGEKETVTKGQKLTILSRRKFHINGSDIPMYVTVRQKSPETKVIKLLRKGHENPAVAVDDELGLMGVADTTRDIRLFLKCLTQSAIAAGSSITLEEISDTLDGKEFNGRNIGSSSDVKMLKFFAKMRGMRIEFILNTNKSYLDYLYKRGSSHEEYEVKRIFDAGVADLVFPEGLYKVNMQVSRDRALQQARERIEN